MPPSLAALSGTCVELPCRFDYPEELRPSAVSGLWYFGSPYPKSYPPVVARSRPGAVHESFAGRAQFAGDPASRGCTLQMAALSAELAGKYYFRGDLGGYNQYSFSEHATLEVWGEVWGWGGGGARGGCVTRGGGRPRVPAPHRCPNLWVPMGVSILWVPVPHRCPHPLSWGPYGCLHPMGPTPHRCPHLQVPIVVPTLWVPVPHRCPHPWVPMGVPTPHRCPHPFS